MSSVVSCHRSFDVMLNVFYSIFVLSWSAWLRFSKTSTFRNSFFFFLGGGGGGAVEGGGGGGGGIVVNADVDLRD